MHEKQLMIPGEIVKKSNALCRATWAPDAIWEARLIAIVATYVNTNDTDFHEYEIKISDVLGDKKDGRTYQRMYETLERATKHVIKIKEDNGSTSIYTVFSKCNISKNRDTVFVSFHPDLKPHFLQLKEKFTQYNILEFMVLPSIYSQRLFEIIKSYGNLHEITIELTELFDMMDINNTMRKFYDFKRHVLNKAHKVINEKTSLKFNWEPIKTKNKVTAIRFIFEKGAKTGTQKTIHQQIKQVAEQTEQIKSFMEQMTHQSVSLSTPQSPLWVIRNAANNCLIAHPNTCTPHLDHAPETCAVCPRYMKKPKN